MKKVVMEFYVKVCKASPDLGGFLCREPMYRPCRGVLALLKIFIMYPPPIHYLRGAFLSHSPQKEREEGIKVSVYCELVYSV